MNRTQTAIPNQRKNPKTDKTANFCKGRKARQYGRAWPLLSQIHQLRVYLKPGMKGTANHGEVKYIPGNPTTETRDTSTTP